MAITQSNKGRIPLKLTAALLALSFVCVPFAPLFAQETIPIPGETQNAYSNPDVPEPGENTPDVPIVNSTSTTKDVMTTTVYPSKFYNTDGTTATKHIFGNGAEVGTVTGTGAEAVPRYTHTDNLTGSNIITNENGTIDETLDYFPFGGIRIDSGSFSDQRKFIGQEYDADTGLNYLNARYYDGTRGQFLSQDPMFWKLPTEILIDPQQQNSYSYARNNPINLSDPGGESLEDYEAYPTVGYYSRGAMQGSYMGVPIYSNGGDDSISKYQCVVFVKSFVKSQYGLEFGGFGNGGQYADQERYNTMMNNQPGSFTVYQNGGTELPKENDIISWLGSENGHVGIVVQTDFDSATGTGTLWTAEQNQNYKKSALRSQSILSNTIDGVTSYTIQKQNNTTKLVPAAFARYNPPVKAGPVQVQKPSPPKSSSGSLWSKIKSWFKK